VVQSMKAFLVADCMLTAILKQICGFNAYSLLLGALKHLNHTLDAYSNFPEIDNSLKHLVCVLVYVIPTAIILPLNGRGVGSIPTVTFSHCGVMVARDF
jgi:hypothetical protein